MSCRLGCNPTYHHSCKSSCHFLTSSQQQQYQWRRDHDIHLRGTIFTPQLHLKKSTGSDVKMGIRITHFCKMPCLGNLAYRPSGITWTGLLGTSLGLVLFYTVVTLKSTGSDVKSGLELPLLDDAEVLGGGLAVIGLLLFFVR